MVRPGGTLLRCGQHDERATVSPLPIVPVAAAGMSLTRCTRLPVLWRVCLPGRPWLRARTACRGSPSRRTTAPSSPRSTRPWARSTSRRLASACTGPPSLLAACCCAPSRRGLTLAGSAGRRRGPDGKWTQEYEKARRAPEYDAALAPVHLDAARRLLKVCMRHGGVYTKFGQYISSMNHVLPAEFTETMAELQDRARSGMDYASVREVIEAELGRKMEDVFEWFDEEPVGTASIAQVHRARTRDGREVAVKVQYRGLPELVRGDLQTMRMLVWMLGMAFPEYEYTWLFPEFEENLKLEMNFEQEGRNGDRVRKMFADSPDVYVPEVHWDLTTPRVLTMEFIEGAKPSDGAALKAIGVESREVAKKISTVFSMMALYHGFVHCDPHPGNMFVRQVMDPSGTPMTQLVVIDHGMYRRLTQQFRTSFCKLWKAMVLGENDLLVEAARELNVGEYAQFLPVIFTMRTIDSKARLGKFMNDEEVKKLYTMAKGITMEDVNRFLQSMPRDILFVVRSMNLVRSLNLSLGGTSRDRFRVLGECAIRGLELNEAMASGQASDGDASNPLPSGNGGLLSAAETAAHIGDPTDSERVGDVGVVRSLRFSWAVFRLKVSLTLADFLLALTHWWWPRQERRQKVNVG